MDELTASLATSFAVSTDPNSTSAPHPRFAEYKKKASGSDQDARRANILEQQKNRRFDYLNYMRRVVEDDWEDAEDLDDVASVDSMDVSQSTDEGKKAYKPGRYYRNQLMLSEWMVEVPEDLEENWLMVCCPWGKRCLIVASRGTTTAYGRNGYRVNSFPSRLPGGNRKLGGRDNAILDCIYHEVEKTFYVLDVMNWKNHPVYDSETDFRFFWMMSKLQETPEVSEVSNLNPYKFVPLKYNECKKETLKEVFENTTEKFDGCLFYCKKAQYTFGASPLVVWLKPYMIPEMLNMEVPEILMSEKPVNYTTYGAHLQHVKDTKEKLAKEKQERITNKKTKRGPDRSRKFKMDLMESKWLLEIPEKIDEDWSMVVCPVGQRCLVMAIDGETKWFSKKGYKLPGYFLSVLPGGNGYEYGYGPTVLTMLDCIYSEEMMTYFVLDCLTWADRDMKGDGYWERIDMMKKAIITRPQFKCSTPLNMFKIVPLYNYECTVDGMDKALRFSSFEVDGFLFYKKDGKYVSGETDDVLWLKPYMLPEVFNNTSISVPRRLMQQMPHTYTDFATFAEEVLQGKHVEKKREKKKKPQEFVPDVVLQLPENPSPAGEGKGKKKKNKKPAQASYFGPGVGFRGRGRGIGQGFYRGGRGGNRNGGQNANMANQRGSNSSDQFDNYGRLLAAQPGGDNQGNVRAYGKGSVSGYSYFGDDRDVYYPDYHPVHGGGGSASRRIRGGHNNQNPFGMGDMEAALPHYNHDQGQKYNNSKRTYKMF